MLTMENTFIQNKHIIVHPLSGVEKCTLDEILSEINWFFITH